jgi:hypothetical protein
MFDIDIVYIIFIEKIQLKIPPGPDFFSGFPIFFLDNFRATVLFT